MARLKTVTDDVKNDIHTDYNWSRAARLSKYGARALPSASVHYALDKFPIIGWLPRYNLRWIINDLIAGITVGLMLIPQSLSYAKIAGIPVEAGLASSWLPATLYAFMGTTKDLSTGPTSLIGLLTSEQVEYFAAEDGDMSEGSQAYTSTQVASAMAFWMGIFGMILGFLNLGFLLDFISLPILNGFISAVAIVIILGQTPSLLGETAGPDSTAGKIHDIFSKLPSANGYACAIGFTGLLFLTVIEKCGKRWSDRYKAVWFITITRAFLCLVIFTGVSYAVNHRYDHKDDYLFGVAQVKGSGIARPEMPPSSLITALPGRSIAIFIGSGIEHVGIARAFAVKNNYVSDQTQELTYYGVVNFINSFFHAMGVGGAMSRTAVNSTCKVKSPLSGLFTTAVVLVCIFKLSSALYWIPKATLAAIIISAVWPLISSPKVFYTYWKTSLADFISAMIAFWVCLFESTEIGIASAVGFNIVYILLRMVFTRVSHAGNDSSLEVQHQIASANTASDAGGIPDGIRVFRFNESFFFANAYRVATAMTDAIQTHHAPNYSSLHVTEAERNWSVAGEKHIAKLRRKANIADPSALPAIRVVVLDFSKCNHIDSTAVTQLRRFLQELKKYGGAGVQCRFAGMTNYIRERFERYCFLLVMDKEGGFSNAQGKAFKEGAIVIRVYEHVSLALVAVVNDDTLPEFDEKGKTETVAESLRVSESTHK